MGWMRKAFQGKITDKQRHRTQYITDIMYVMWCQLTSHGIRAIKTTGLGEKMTLDSIPYSQLPATSSEGVILLFISILLPIKLAHKGG